MFCKSSRKPEWDRSKSLLSEQILKGLEDYAAVSGSSLGCPERLASGSDDCRVFFAREESVYGPRYHNPNMDNHCRKSRRLFSLNAPAPDLGAETGFVEASNDSYDRQNQKKHTMFSGRERKDLSSLNRVTFTVVPINSS